MKIKKLFLDLENNLLLDAVTLGDKIRVSGKMALWEERKQSLIDVIVIHYISAAEIKPSDPFDLKTILGIFCDYGVSSHYMINRKGVVMHLVPEQEKAWHCGGSIMPEPDNRTGVNEFSIGIELMATATSSFTKSQYLSLCNLCTDIEIRHGRKFKYVGHDQVAGERAVVSGLRKTAKSDPGYLFDWEYFFDLMEKNRQNRT